ncbi:MAG: MoaD family protein [Dehalococcoidia bacterium]
MAQVKFLGKLREITGVITEEVESSQVRQVLERLTERFGPELSELLFPPENGAELSGDIQILVNGRNIGFLDGLDTDLEPEDRITILYHGARGYPGG